MKSQYVDNEYWNILIWRGGDTPFYPLKSSSSEVDGGEIRIKKFNVPPKMPKRKSYFEDPLQRVERISAKLKQSEKNAIDLGLEFSSHISSLGIEGDRSAVLIATARLDVLLEKFLRTQFVDDKGAADSLFDAEKPLRSFSAKISLSYCIGIIDKEVQSCLHLIRKIRNDCAHIYDPIKLDKPPHVDRVNELAKTVFVSPLGKGIYDVLAKSGVPDTRAKFIASVGYLMTEIELSKRSTIIIEEIRTATIVPENNPAAPLQNT